MVNSKMAPYRHIRCYSPKPTSALNRTMTYCQMKEKGPNLIPALAGTTLEMQKTVLAAEMLMSVHQVNVDKPILLLGEWKLETQICHVDRVLASLFFASVRVRSGYILPSPNFTCGIILGMLL